MKLVQQKVVSVSLIPSLTNDALKEIERIGRLCYKSERFIKDKSYIEFYRKLIERGHYAMLEHSVIHVAIRTDDVSKLPFYMIENPYIRLKVISAENEDGTTENSIIISGSFRGWVEMLLPFYRSFGKDLSYLEVFENLEDYITGLLATYNVQHQFVPNEMAPDDLMVFSVHLKTCRGVSHELVRHSRPPAAYAQESQRWIKYKNIEFIEPFWWDTASPQEKDLYIKHCEHTESLYKFYRDGGRRAEESRVVLHNNTKTEIIMTTYGYHLNHIFQLRTADDVYPPMRDAMNKFRKRVDELKMLAKANVGVQ